MTLLDRLIDQLDARGLAVVPGDEPGQLRVTGPKAEITPDVLEAVKAFEPLLLERFGRADPSPTAAGPAAPAEEPPAPQPAGPVPGAVCHVRGDGQHPAGGPGGGGHDVPAVAEVPGLPVGGGWVTAAAGYVAGLEARMAAANAEYGDRVNRLAVARDAYEAGTGSFEDVELAEHLADNAARHRRHLEELRLAVSMACTSLLQRRLGEYARTW